MADPVNTVIVRSVISSVIAGISALFGRDRNNQQCPTLAEIEHARNNRFTVFQGREIGFLGVPDSYYDALAFVVSQGNCTVDSLVREVPNTSWFNHTNPTPVTPDTNISVIEPPPVLVTTRPNEEGTFTAYDELKQFIMGDLDFLEATLLDVETDIVGSIISSTNQSKGDLNRVEQVLSDLIFNQIGLVTGRQDRDRQDIIDLIGDEVESTKDYTDFVADIIIGATNRTVRDSENRVINASRVYSDGIQSDISRVTTQLNSLSNNFNSGIDSVLDVAGSILGAIQSGLEVEITNQIVIPSSVFSVITDAVQDVIGGVLGTVGGILDVVVGEISDGIRAIVGTQIIAAEAQTAVLVDIEGAIRHNKDIDTNSLKEIASGKFFEAILKNADPVTRDKILQAARSNFTFALPDYCSDDDILEMLVSPVLPEDSSGDIIQALLSTAFDFVIWLVSSAITPLTIAQAKAQSNLSAWALCPENSFLFLQPGDAIAAAQRGLITNDQALQAVKSAGYTLEDSVALIGTGYTVPNLELLYSLNLRGLLDESGFDQAMKGLGYSEAWLDALKELKFFIPPVQDLITMAVREVFSPETAERFGQFEDFPEAFRFWAEKQGVSEEWAKNYWAAHWALPSVQMGYEMLHRRVITEQDLDLLLKAQDVMPFWRDKLKAISYSPLTRVDVRRMHQLGVLSDQEVYESYLDLGYNPENAARMRDFTIQLNKGDETLLDQELEGLTRSNLIGFFKDGTLNKDETLAFLLAIGLPIISAELFLDNAEYEMESKERKRLVNLTLDRLRNEAISAVDARARISDLDITQTEKELAYADIDSIEARNNKIPSVTDMNKFVKAGITDKEEFIDVLEARGYSNYWAEKYWIVANGG